MQAHDDRMKLQNLSESCEPADFRQDLPFYLCRLPSSLHSTDSEVIIAPSYYYS